MKPDPLAQATALLQREISDVGDVDAVPASRAEAVARIGAALAQRRTARRRRKIGMIAAAAVVLLAAGAFATRRTDAPRARAPVSEQARVATVASVGLTAIREGHEIASTPGERLGDGTELRTSPTSEANLEFESGSRLAVGTASRLHLVEQTRHKRFALDRGSVRAKVAKLAVDERFVVTTSDSEIEVRGTEFDVRVVEPDPTCGDGTPTRVDVREGVVVVRHDGKEDRVAAGEHWPRCASSEPAPSAIIAPSAPRTAPRPPAPSPPSASPATSASASRLSAQNDLFQDAMRRKRSGDLAGAVATLERLRTDYADGPLAENAEVERFRILSSFDRARGVSAAREYLRTRPRGFARAEAEAIVAGSP